MVTKKDLVIAILCTFCLTASLFMVIPTRSSPDIGDYDPWIDVNDDGVIDISDLVIMVGTIPSEGDPTKNVNVTNFPLDGQGNLRVNVIEKPLQTYNECVSVQLLSFEGDALGTAQGIKLFNPLSIRQEFLFCFSPKSIFLNITDIWIGGVGMAASATYIDNWNMIINNYELNVVVSLPAVTEFTMFKLHITDNEFYKAIKPNTTNILGILDLLNSMHLYSLTIFVEYRYQAR